MADLKISNETNASAEDGKMVEDALHRFNFDSTQIPYAPRPVTVFLQAGSGEIKGGLIGNIIAGWLGVSTLWIDEKYRHQGYGGRLLQVAETEARDAGYKYARLDTFEFQARPFYERFGYECFGVLNDHPLGHTHYFMYKRLA
jgi:GNAT superfamily N-acetyltransferase